MRNYAIGYLVYQFFYRILEFLRHWYVRGTKIYWHFVFNRLEDIDKTFAFKTTIRLWFQPLYGDHSIIGHVLGFIFRTTRIIMGGVVHGTLVAFALAAYLVWLLLPFVLVYGATTGDFLLTAFN